MGVLDVPFREDFIFIPEWLALALYIAAALTVVALAYGIYLKVRPIGLRNLIEVFVKNIGENISFTLRQWLLQRRLMFRRYPGVMHWGLFFGILVLFIGTVIVFIDYDILRFLNVEVLRGGNYLAFEAFLDVFGIFFIAGVLLALWRRIVVKPTYLENRRWDFIVLAGLLYIGITGFVIEGLRLAMKPVPWAGWSIFGNLFAEAFRAAGVSASIWEAVYQAFWMSHALVAFILIAVLPYSTLFHIILSSANVLKSKVKPIGRVSTPFKLAELMQTGNFEVKVGFNTVQELPWDRRLMLIACTNCGRCQDACPATAAGRALNPRLVIQHLGSVVKGSANGWGQDVFQGVVSEGEVWGCTMCGACVQECPVLIRKPDFLIDLRRYLIANGRADQRMNLLLTNLQTHGNPFGARSHDRNVWMEGLNIKTLDDEPNVEYLYWVGCAAAFDQRAQSVARATATLLQKAGVSFGVLGVKEKCTGEVVRRLGEEGLFQQLALENIETLKSYNVKKIITHCPHCYNTFKNEYPEFGGDFEVKHHTEILLELIKEGRLKLKKEVNLKAALHDSCYLGRYNKIYEEPRMILISLPNFQMVKIRERERSFCCGAGGANFWYKVEEQTRIPDLRLDEVIKAGASLLAVECPYCLSMFEESRKISDRYQKLVVKDISEIILEALEE
ncbi:MAG: heterodisulfide reductase-related iron-sulfur binding cluster [Nitrososphaerales archaeon]